MSHSHGKKGVKNDPLIIDNHLVMNFYFAKLISSSIRPREGVIFAGKPVGPIP